MRPKKAPGVIPEWGNEFTAMPMATRELFARTLGVTVRTLMNWAQGKTMPTKATSEMIRRRMNRGKA